ncbi:MAG: replication-relaxation family protein, partial [Dehalococcoidia bacterium]|nr:replication-relaxation family protein [Dehalococcoidia bacterium]
SRRPKYGLAWLRMFGDHYALVRKFALALVYGGRGVSNAIGEVQTRVVTTIGSRLLYRDHRRWGQEKQTGVVKPDGLVWVRINQCGWMDGAASASKPVCENTLWLEVDRGTIPLKRLESKLDGYGSIWESLQAMNPALVWVIEGTPAREASILAMMRVRGVHGWTVLMERLVLTEEDPWWIQNAPGSTSRGSIRVGLKYEAIGGMAPWREIWSTITGMGGQPLLGVQPWRNRKLRRTPPRKGEQQSIKYKVG